jgi:hypothetical protein
VRSNLIIAVDPGASGGYAYILGEDGEAVASKLPETDTDTLDELRTLLTRSDGQGELYIEAVSPFTSTPGMGASMAKLYGGQRFIIGVAMTLGYRIVEVHPKKWQKHFELGNKKDHGKNWKNVLKDKAQRRFPDIKVTLATADSLLILEYALNQ